MARLDFDEVVAILREWVGRDVVLIRWAPTFSELDRPYFGKLRYVDRESTELTAVFVVPTSPSRPHLTNPEGIKFVVYRRGFGGGEWVGGPEPGVGLSIRQGVSRLSVFPQDRICFA